MRTRTLVILLFAGCAGGETDTDTHSHTSGLCAVERALTLEQQALGLVAPSVCENMVQLGDTTLVEAGLVPVSVDFGAILSPESLPHRAELEGRRRLLSYDGMTLSVASGSEEDLELAVLTAQAWSLWQSKAPGSFGVMADMSALPTAPTLDCCSWRNRYDHVVVSLDATPIEIGASVALVGQPIEQDGEQIYPNTALISLHRKTVMGADSTAGSRPIYGATDDRENALRYFADGAVFTLAHESAHLYIDHRNSVSAVANRIWNGRTFINASYVSAEEVIANYTACEALSGQLTAEMAASQAQVTTTLRSYEGVEDRLDDLRTYPLGDAERLKLTASADCGG